MKIKLLPSTIDERGRATAAQRLSCFLIDARVAIDAGSIAIAASPEERARVRDIIITHPHMDHIATLPIFVDDLFATLTEPIRIHAAPEVVALLERDVFNGTVYPPFHEFSNERTRVLEFVPLPVGRETEVAHLRVTAVPVSHIVPTCGLLLTDGRSTLAFSSDTTATEEFWRLANAAPRLDALLIEASFPDELARLAEASGHLTPAALAGELRKLRHTDLDILAVHLKASFREEIIGQLAALGIPRLKAMLPGHVYQW